MLVAGAGLWSETFVTALISGGILASIPIMFAGLGETISERAGVLNIGIEGMMLLGAYTGFLGAYYTDSTWVGYLAGAGGGFFISLFMVVLCVRLGLDQIVIGIALTLTVEGVTSLLQGAQFGTTYPRLGNAWTLRIPGLADIPVVGASLFEQNLLVYLGFALVAATAWMLRSTGVGLEIRAAGERPEAVDAAGVSVVATRSWAVASCGALTGLGGAYLSIVGAGIFVPFMTQGRGFIGIVLALLSRGRPGWVPVGAFIFGMSLSLSDALQLAGVEISTDVVNMLPFLAVIVALIVFARRSYLPSALGLPYVRGAR